MENESLLPANWEIPDTLRERVGDEPGRQRIMLVDGHLLLVLHAPPKPDEAARNGCFFWRDSEGNWASECETNGPAALTALLDHYKSAVDALRDAEDVAKTSQEYFDLLKGLSPLARSIRNMYDTLQAARKEEKNDRRIIVARDRAYALHRQAELLDTDARNSLELALAIKTEEQAASSFQMARAAHRLNMMVAFFFPIATLSAIFGTNWRAGMAQFKNKEGPLPLLLLVVAGVALGVGLMLFVNWRMRSREGGEQETPQD